MNWKVNAVLHWWECFLRFTTEFIPLLIVYDYSVMTNAFIRALLLVNCLTFCSLAFLFKVSIPAVVVTEINAATNLHLLSMQVGRAEFWPNCPVLLSNVMIFRFCHDKDAKFSQLLLPQ